MILSVISDAKLVAILFLICVGTGAYYVKHSRGFESKPVEFVLGFITGILGCATVLGIIKAVSVIFS